MTNEFQKKIEELEKEIKTIDKESLYYYEREYGDVGEEIIIDELKAKLQAFKEAQEIFLTMVDEIISDIGDDEEAWKHHGKLGFEELKSKIKGK